MILALLFFVVSLKVYKKTSPNGKLTVYLGKRDFIDHCDGNVDPVEGVVSVEKDYLKGRKIFGQLVTTYRYGREEDEVMGVKFSRVIPLAWGQIVPSDQEKSQITKLQQRLMDKLGGNAYPFYFKFPSTAPSSVIIQSGDEGDKSKPLGVEYRVRTFVGESIDDPGHKRSTVSLAIKKLQFAPIEHLDRLPSALASKSFTFSQGRVTMEITLNKEIFYHGESVLATLVVTNNSRKTVKNLKCPTKQEGRVSPCPEMYEKTRLRMDSRITQFLDMEIVLLASRADSLFVMQHVELTMVSMQLMNTVSSLETKEGCPITPGHSFSKEFILTPLALNNKDKRGIALDGYLKDDDVNLASSTISVSGKLAPDSLGVVIGYTVRGKLSFGTLGGELVADVPMKLVHRDSTNPTSKPQKDKPSKSGLQKIKSIDRAHYENTLYAADEEENIVFEDFARHRMSEVEE